MNPRPRRARPLAPFHPIPLRVHKDVFPLQCCQPTLERPFLPGHQNDSRLASSNRQVRQMRQIVSQDNPGDSIWNFLVPLSALQKRDDGFALLDTHIRNGLCPSEPADSPASDHHIPGRQSQTTAQEPQERRSEFRYLEGQMTPDRGLPIGLNGMLGHSQCSPQLFRSPAE